MEAKRVQAQVKSLSEQLQKAKEKQESQEKLIRTMKEELHEERPKKPAQIQESLEDVGAELQQMRGELHKLMGEIENKEQAIQQLEAELRQALDSADSKEHTVSDLKKLVSDLERHNSSLKSSLEQRHMPIDSSGDERSAFVIKTSEKSLKEELEKAVKSKTEGQPLKFKPATGLFLSKSLGHPISTLTSGESQGAPGASGDSEPDKPGTENADRLQSLISKYRSHSSDPLSGPSSPVGGAKARVSSAPPTFRAGGLGSPKGRGFTPGSPKAPLLRTESASSSSKYDETSSPKTGKKLPPPPPPKPGKSLMKILSGGEGGARAEREGPSDQMLDSQEQSDINALIQKFDEVAEFS